MYLFLKIELLVKTLKLKNLNFGAYFKININPGKWKSLSPF